MRTRMAVTLLLLGAVLAKSPKRLVVHGEVEFSDQSAPQELVAIEKVCKGVTELAGYANSEGGFKIDLGAVEDVPGAALADCEVQAYLPGYRSQKLPLRGASVENSDLGTLTLKPLGKQAAVSKSANDKAATKPAQKIYGKALDAAGKGNLKSAEDLFEQATAVSRAFPSVWLNLGVLQERKGDLSAAKKSYKEAVQWDDAFARAHLHAA